MQCKLEIHSTYQLWEMVFPNFLHTINWLFEINIENDLESKLSLTFDGRENFNSSTFSISYNILNHFTNIHKGMLLMFHLNFLLHNLHSHQLTLNIYYVKTRIAIKNWKTSCFKHKSLNIKRVEKKGINWFCHELYIGWVFLEVFMKGNSQ